MSILNTIGLRLPHHFLRFVGFPKDDASSNGLVMIQKH
jgi:hypothetical protein